jgi:tetratricopeptide (TPR) repeat protein
MNKEESISINNHDVLKALKGKYLCARKQLQQARSKRQKRKLTEYIEDLKMDLAWTLLDCGEHEEGLALYISVCGKQYRERKYNGMARALTEMGYYDEARKLLEVGLRRFPKSYALWVAMGALCDSLGDTSDLLKCIEIALLFAPEDNSTGLYNKALAMIKLGCYGDALPIIDELIERYPEDPKHLAERGSCALEMGYSQEALQYYQKAMEVWKRSPTIYEGICVYSGLCSSYMELGMKTEAMEIALEGLKKFPDEDPVLYHNVGATFYEMGWRNECIEILKKGAKKFPKDEELKEFLKDVEDDIDDPDGGEKPPLLGLLLLMGLIRKKLKNFRK